MKKCEKLDEIRARLAERQNDGCSKRRKDADDGEGRWITTENGHHVHINAEGEPDKGNSHVIDKMNSGSANKGSKKLTIADYRNHEWKPDENGNTSKEDHDFMVNLLKNGDDLAVRMATSDVIDAFESFADGTDGNKAANVWLLKEATDDFSEAGKLGYMQSRYREAFDEPYPVSLEGYRSWNFKHGDEDLDDEFAALCYKYGDNRLKREIESDAREYEWPASARKKVGLKF